MASMIICEYEMVPDSMVDFTTFQSLSSELFCSRSDDDSYSETKCHVENDDGDDDDHGYADNGKGNQRNGASSAILFLFGKTLRYIQFD